jgi:hypothetical protein
VAISPQSSPFGKILLAVQSQLVASIVTNVGQSPPVYISPSYIRIVANDDYNADQMIVDDWLIIIRVYGIKPTTDAGAGRLCRPASRNFRTYIYRRNSLDDAADDQIALTDPLMGLLSVEEQVFNCLDDFWPGGMPSGSPLSQLMIEPIHILAENLPPERPAVDEIGLLRTSLTWESRYVLPENWTTFR